jgi:hypothetical protein
VKRVPIFAAAAASFLLLWTASPPWPDDWDGLGFLASIKHFDLDAFAPHPPGYPVYVALLKIASLAFPSTPSGAVAAASLVASLSGAATVALLATALRAAGARVSVSALLGMAVVATPLGFHCLSVVGSEAPALALASLCAYGLAGRSSVALGVGVGLGLGVRVSWAPLFLPMLLIAPRELRARAWLVAFASTLAWAAPFVVEVGPAHLVHLLAAHVAGHATRWGGTVLTEPTRIQFLARDLFVDGLGADEDPLGIAIGVVLLFALVLGLVAWKNAGWERARPVATVFVPYLVWIAVGQNLREQPRHALPLIALLAVGLAAAAIANRSSRLACIILFGLMVLRTATDAGERRRIPPAGAAIVEYVRSLLGEPPDPSRALVFGGASVRFFEGTELASSARGAESMADVGLALGRVRVVPPQLFVTTEVADTEPPLVPPSSVKSVVTFCRPPRLDRKRPCVNLVEIDRAKLPIP